MTASPPDLGRRLVTPRAAAVAGVLFAVLLGTSTVLLRMSVPPLDADSGEWIAANEYRIDLALWLIPFAGIAFLWFIAVARERLGRFEDQFFSTVFIGSGLLFLAMMFAAAAGAGAIVAAAANDPEGFASSTTYTYARQAVTQILAVYALRMAAIFQLSQASLWLRTRVMPRWMALVTIVVALLLLFVFTQAWWVVLVFPAWVLLVSVYILIARSATDPAEAGDQPN